MRTKKLEKGDHVIADKVELIFNGEGFDIVSGFQDSAEMVLSEGNEPTIEKDMSGFYYETECTKETHEPEDLFRPTFEHIEMDGTDLIVDLSYTCQHCNRSMSFAGPLKQM